LIEKVFTEEEQLLNSSKVDCSLDKIGNVVIRHTGNISEGEITLRVETDGVYKNLTICTAWTTNIISVSEDNCTDSCLIEQIPARLQNKVDKCFNTETTLNKDKIDVKFKITSDNANSLDEITFYIFDKDTADNFELLSEYEGINLGSEDKIYTIKYT
jgi:hypothetical protein